MQVTVNVKDKRDLSSAFDKRISVLEKLLVEVKKSGKRDTQSIIKAMEKTREKEVRMFSKMADSFSVVSKGNGKPKDDSSLVKSIGKRISLLEGFLKRKRESSSSPSPS